MNFNYQNINFDVLSTHCFEPNLTTKIFADAVLEKLNRENKQSSILELGCGTGILTIILN